MTRPHAFDTRRHEERALVTWMLRAFVAWFVVYLFVQGQDGVFARTVERVEAPWVALVFLNLPLQLALAFAAGLCLVSRRPGLRGAALWLAAVDAVLIWSHILLSVATA